jgi:DNA-binding beta-propeller fold protein YncE
MSVAVSPDGRNVYVASGGSSGVAVFDRDSSGVLTQKATTAGCINEFGNDGCADGIALLGASGVAVAPDGENVYVAARASDSVVVFDRNVLTGALTQKNGIDGCVSEDGTLGDCVNGVALDFAWGVASSPDGRSVYVVSDTSGAIAVFDRNLSTGALTQKAGTAGCISDDGTGGQCVNGNSIDDPFLVAVSPDGQSVYVAAGSDHAVAVFDRDTSTGALTQKPGAGGCVGETNVNGCTDGVALSGVHGVAVSADGRNVYGTAASSNGVAVFSRDVAAYDIDGDGQTEPLTDGLLLLRYLFGFTGPPLVTGAVDLVNCTRCTAPAIEAYIGALLNV